MDGLGGDGRELGMGEARMDLCCARRFDAILGEINIWKGMELEIRQDGS